MLKKIEEPDKYEICEFDSVNAAHVYLGSFDNLTKAELKWRTDPELGKACFGNPKEGHVLTLKEIQDQLKKQNTMITIFLESPTNGKILQYGNYGDSWWIIGETSGYA